MEIDAEIIEQRIAELERAKLPGWQDQVERLLNLWAQKQGQPRIARTATTELPPPAKKPGDLNYIADGIALEDGKRVLALELDSQKDAPAKAPPLHTAELAVVCQWLGILAGEAPTLDDAPEFWRGCQVFAWIVSGEQETIRELSQRFKMSIGGTHALVNRTKASLLRIRSVLANQSNTPPISEDSNANN
jgi:hypothetical protein